jgi:hypothetical protein
VKQNSGLVINLAKLGAGLVAVGGSMAGLGLALNGVGTSLVFLSGSAKVAAVAMRVLTVAMLANPWVAALTAIAVAVGALTGKFDPLLEKMREYLGLNAKMPGGSFTGEGGQIRGGELQRSEGDAPALNTPAMIEARRQRFFDKRQADIDAARAREEESRKANEPKAPGMDLQAIGSGLKLEFDIKKSQIGRGLNLGKQWAEGFWDGMEEERARREGLFEDIARQQESIANQERSIAEQRDNSNIITGSSAAAVAGLGINSIDQRQLTELEKMNDELEKLRKELAGER